MKNVRIDIVSDVMCPWCVVGFMGLSKALEAMDDKINAEIHWQPFELNPGAPAEGQNMREHLMEKYGITEEQSVQNREQIRKAGEALGFTFNFTEDMRMANTFNAHQLLHWAGEQDRAKQTELKLALFNAHLTEGKNVNDANQLAELVEQVGLDKKEALAVIADQRFAMEVRANQQQWQEAGVRSVPAVILQQKYLISGGQPPEAFIQALTQVIQEDA